MDLLIPRMLSLNIVACKGVLFNNDKHIDAQVDSSWDGGRIDSNTKSTYGSMVRIHVNYNGTTLHSDNYPFNNDMVFNFNVQFPFPMHFRPSDVIQIYLTSTCKLSHSHCNHIGCTQTCDLIGMTVIEIGTLLSGDVLHFEPSANMNNDGYENDEDDDEIGDFVCDHYLSAEIFTSNNVQSYPATNSSLSEGTVLNGILFVKPKICKFPYVQHIAGREGTGKQALYGDIVSFQEAGAELADNCHVLQEFFHNSTVWYNKLLKQYPHLLNTGHHSRAIKLFARDETAQFRCVCDFISPLKTPSECLGVSPSVEEVPLHLARFVSLLPHRGEFKATRAEQERQATAILLGTVDQGAASGTGAGTGTGTGGDAGGNKGHYLSLFALFSTMQCNGVVDYCHLLCSLLLGCKPSTHVYVAFGSIKVNTHGVDRVMPYYWVVTLEDEVSMGNTSGLNKNNSSGRITKKIVYWDAMSGKQYRVVDTGSAVTTFNALQGTSGVHNSAGTAGSGISSPIRFYEIYALYNHQHYYVNLQKHPEVALTSIGGAAQGSNSLSTNAGNGGKHLYDAFNNIHETYVSYDLNNSNFWVLFPIRLETSTTNTTSAVGVGVGAGESTLSSFRRSNALTLAYKPLSNKQILDLTGNVAYQLPFQLLLQEQYYARDVNMAAMATPSTTYDVPSYIQYECSTAQLERYIESHLKHAIKRWREEDHKATFSANGHGYTGATATAATAAAGDEIVTAFDDSLHVLLQVGSTRVYWVQQEYIVAVTVMVLYYYLLFANYYLLFAH